MRHIVRSGPLVIILAVLTLQTLHADLTSIGDRTIRFTPYRAELQGVPPEEGGAGMVPYNGGGIVLPAGGERFALELRGEFAAKPADGPASLFLGPTNSPVELFVNGVLLYRWGNPGDPYVSTNYTCTQITLPPQLLLPGAPNRVSLRFYPLFQTSPLPTVAVGSSAEVARSVFYRNLIRAYMVRSASVVALFLGLYFLMLYLNAAERRRQYLWFALFSFAFFAAYLEVSFSFSATSELLIKKLSKIGFVWSLTFLSFFLLDFASVDRLRRPLQLLLAGLGSLFTVAFLTRGSIEGVESVLSLVILAMFGPALILDSVLVVRSVRRVRGASPRIILAAFLLCLAATFHDMYVIIIDVIPYSYTTAYGFLALVIGIFSVLVLEQGRISRDNARWARETDENNRLMRDIFSKITAVSAGLSNDGESLERTVGETRQVVEGAAAASLRDGAEIQNSLGSLERTISDSARSLEVSGREIPEALKNLSDFSESLTEAVTRLTGDLESLMSGAAETGKQASGFSRIADSGSTILAESTGAINSIGGYSAFVEEVLQTVEGISEQMHLLSINASIEAARAGAAGEGFKVVAHEIRTLSQTAREKLGSSFEKIEALKEVVRRSGELGESLDSSLTRIMQGAGSTAQTIDRMAASLELELGEVRKLRERADAMKQDTETIRGLVDSGQRETRRLSEAFETVSATISGIRGMISRQEAESEELRDAVASVAAVGERSFANARILAGLIRDELGGDE